MSASNILNRLELVRSNGKGKWSARCPAHQDRGPSLSIRETEDGTVLIHCFAGCGAADVLAAIGFTLGELFPDDPKERKAAQHRLVAADVIDAAHHEVMVALASVSDLRAGQPIDVARLELAQTKLRNILDQLGRFRR